MNENYLNQLEAFSSRYQKPFQKLVNLNVQVLKDINFLTADELLKIKKPEELIEKQFDIAIKNGHLALNYFKNSLAMMSSLALSFSENIRKEESTLDSMLKKETNWNYPMSVMEHLPKPLIDPSLTVPKVEIEIANIPLVSTKAKKPRTKKN